MVRMHDSCWEWERCWLCVCCCKELVGGLGLFVCLSVVVLRSCSQSTSVRVVWLADALRFGVGSVTLGLQPFSLGFDDRAPRYLADHLTPASDVASRLRLRSANRHQLIVPRCRLNTYGRRAFTITGPTPWNSLPRELRDPACGFDSFKQFLKTILFSLY